MFPLHRMLILGVLLGAGVLVLFASLVATPAQASNQEFKSPFVSFAPLVGSDPAPTPTSAPAIKAAPVKQSAPPAAADSSCALGSFPESVKRWCDLIQRHAATAGLDPNVIAAVMLQESGGNPQAYSHSGAVGLLQVMPRDGIAASFQCVNGPCFGSRPSMAELYDPEYNVRYGINMLAGLLQRHGNLRDALRAYGPGDAGYTYADKVLAIYKARSGN
jgi:soluble lytic murein transglycosylase-like protein